MTSFRITSNFKVRKGNPSSKKDKKERKKNGMQGMSISLFEVQLDSNKYHVRGTNITRLCT